jgi:hypothetical protein
MNIHIDKSHVARAHKVAGRTPEEIADLVETEPSTAIGIFSTDIGEPWRAHHLAGEIVDVVTDDVRIFRFETSTASFTVKQELRRREEERRKKAEEEERKRKRTRATGKAE